MAFTGDKVTAVATSSDTQNTSGTATGTTYTATLSGGTACGLAFIAPASGQVLILNSCFVAPPSGPNGFASIRVRTGGSVGSGTDVVAASDSNAVIPASGPAYVRGTSHLTLPGLTPGSTYNVQQVFRLDGAGSITVRDKHLSVVGLP